MKWIASVFIALTLAVPAVDAFAQRGPASVFAETVTEREFSREIEALGTLEPNEQVDLTLNVADRVRSIYFDDGQRVRKGKTLLSLAQREQAALVEAAEADVEEALQQFERIQRLQAAQAVSKAELDEAQRRLNSVQANLRALQSRQRDRVLVAPFDGVLGFRQVSVGSFVRAGDIVATLIDDSEMNLDFDIPSLFLRSAVPGTEITAQSDDLPGETFRGTITTLNNRIDPVTRSVTARATLPNDDRLLRSGMFMRVLVRAAPRRALAIPEEAVQPLGPKTYVWRLVDEDGQNIVRRAEVQLGSRAAGYIEVISGLSRGDIIVTEGIIRVREGAAVIIKDKSMLEPGSAKSGNTSNATRPRSGQAN